MQEPPKSFLVINENFSIRKIEFTEESGWEIYKWSDYVWQWDWDDSITEEIARDWFGRGEIFIKKD